MGIISKKAVEKMEFIYGGNSKSGGVYKITNKTNGRTYYGSAKCFQVRWAQHEYSLVSGKHSNKFLQADFNKCSAASFLFEVLEVVEGTKEDRLLKEEVYLKQYFDNGKQCYNLCDRAISREGAKDLEDSKQRRSLASKKKWADPEYKEKMLANLKRIHEDPEIQEKMQTGRLLSWEGNDARKEATSKRFKGYYKDPEYYANIYKVLRDPEIVAKGRDTFRKRLQEDLELKEKFREDGRNKVASIQKKYIEDPEFKKTMDEHSIKNIQEYNAVKIEQIPAKPAIISPDGTIYRDIKSASAFAREHGLNTSTIYKLYNGKAKSVKGWKLFKE